MTLRYNQKKHKVHTFVILCNHNVLAQPFRLGYNPTQTNLQHFSEHKVEAVAYSLTLVLHVYGERFHLQKNLSLMWQISHSKRD